MAGGSVARNRSRTSPTKSPTGSSLYQWSSTPRPHHCAAYFAGSPSSTSSGSSTGTAAGEQKFVPVVVGDAGWLKPLEGADVGVAANGAGVGDLGVAVCCIRGVGILLKSGAAAC